MYKRLQNGSNFRIESNPCFGMLWRFSGCPICANRVRYRQNWESGRDSCPNHFLFGQTGSAFHPIPNKWLVVGYKCKSLHEGVEALPDLLGNLTSQELGIRNYKNLMNLPSAKAMQRRHFTVAFI
ncbi:uncharacterized protein [Malus domestica]|uniref:uncharacterized protein isoform X1 n=1 Tax=Malus domestica TaxID=3750 RepID=UPI00397689D9